MKNLLFEIPDYSGAGVYAIINAEKFICYVGSTKNINKRAKQHNSLLFCGKHPNKSLQKDIRYEFTFVILHKFNNISRDDLKIAEKIYMIAMIVNGFDLYNKKPENNRENLCYSVVCDLFSKLDTYKNIEKHIFETYHIKLWQLKTRKPENRNEYIKHKK